jgi:hypothetical protein
VLFRSNGYWPLELNLENNNATFGGIVSAPAGSFRAPIFYDSENTNYYLDPNSASVLSTVTITNNYVNNAIYFGGGNNYLNWDGARINSNVGIQSTSDMRAPIFYDSANTSYYLDPNATSVLSSAHFDSGILDNASTRVVIPGGAYSVNNPGGTVGAIKISLPTACFGINTMMSMTVHVYEYSTGQSFTIKLGGYNYYTYDWYNVFAYMVNDSGKSVNVPVYFGHDGTRNIVWLGEANWGWDYPNVFVTDFQAGHSQNSNWKTGWSVSFSTAARTNVGVSRVAYKQVDAGNIGSQSVSYATTAGALSSMNISQFSNNSGYLTGITSGQVTGALGYTPYNSTNPNGYITGISFANVSSKPTTISG